LSQTRGQPRAVGAAGGRRIFYGWWIVLASGIGLSTSPGQFVFGSLGLFIVPLGGEFGWDRAEVSLALTFFTATLALSLPVIGRLVDRYGSRRVLVPSMLVVGMGLALVPLFARELWQLYLIYSLLGSLGAGANNLAYMRTISAWFDRRRGLAIGLAIAGSGLGYAYVPPLIQHLVDTAGWRMGYYVLAAITVFIAVPVVALCLKERPGDVGLYPDGVVGDPRTLVAATEQGLPRSRVLRSRVFWQLFLVFCVLSFSLYGVLSHLVPMLGDRGMSSGAAAFAAATVGVTIMVARVIVGFLVDRYFAPMIAMAAFVLSAAGLLVLATGVAGMPVFVAAVLIGFSIGAEVDLLAYLTTRYFGLRSFGAVYGLMFAALLFGTSFGPVAYGMAFESYGSYAQILILSAVLTGFAAALLALLPRFPQFTSTAGTASEHD